jgi:ATP-binding cassette subfamily B protein
MSPALREARTIARAMWRIAPVATTLGVVLAPVNVLTVVGLAIAQRALIDTGPGDDLARVIAVALGSALVFACILTFGSMQWVLTQLAGHRTVPVVQRDLLRLIDRRREFEDLASPQYADDIERLRRDVRHAVDLGWIVYMSVMDVVALALSSWLLVSVDWRLLVVVLGAALSLVVSSLTMRGVVNEEQRLTVLRRHERRLHESCVVPGGVQETRSYHAEEALDSRATAIWREVARRRVRSRVVAALRSSVSWVVLGAALVVGVGVLIGEIGRGSATIGDLILLITLTLGLRGQLSGAVDSIDSIGKALPALRSLARIRDRADDRDPGDLEVRTRMSDGIVVRDLDFGYAGSDRLALREVDVEIPAGTVLAIVGQNGAGKSTLANLLLGILTPSRGEVRVDGSAVRDPGWRRSSSGAFQDFMKPRLVLREAVGLGEVAGADDRERVMTAMRTAGGERLLESLPDGLETSLSDRDGTGLSHGQWQIVALARSGMRDDPALLVLDEPSSALDAHAEHELFTRFIEHGRAAGRERGAISVVISHRYSAAYLADLVLVVEEGRVIESGTHAELMARGGEYHRMFELQREAYS